MKIATISKLKAKLSEHLAMVKRGEEVVVTDRGRPVARIVPVGPESLSDKRLRDLVARGVLRAGQGKVRPRISRLPVCTMAEGAVLEALDEERRERA
jgi:prevent-host-death family protein